MQLPNLRIHREPGRMASILDNEVVIAAQDASDDRVSILRGTDAVRFWQCILEGRDLRSCTSDLRVDAASLTAILRRLEQAGLLRLEEGDRFDAPASDPQPSISFDSLRVRDLLPADLVIQGASPTGGTNDGAIAQDTVSPSPCPPPPPPDALCMA